MDGLVTANEGDFPETGNIRILPLSLLKW